MDQQKQAERFVNHMFKGDAFSRWLGITIIEIKPGRSVLEMKVRTEMLNGFKVCHGGIPFSLADSALAFASNTHGTITVSIEDNMAFTEAIYEGDLLRATADELSAGNRIATYNVTVERIKGTSKELVAVFRGTVYRTQKEFPSETKSRD